MLRSVERSNSVDQDWNDTHGRLSETALNWIRSNIEGLRFGDVKIVVREGKIVQIDRQEKERHHEAARKHAHQRDPPDGHSRRAGS